MMKKLFLVFICLSLVTAKLFAQADAELVAEADTSYKFGAKLLALQNYELALRSNPKNVRANFMSGKCILETSDKGRAAQYFLKSYQLDPNYDPAIFYFIARSYQFGKDFDKALEYYNKYKQQLVSQGIKPKKKKKGQTDPEDKFADIDRRIEQCNNGKKYLADPLGYSIQNIGDKINSEFPDYAPAINKDENLIIFTSKREGGTGQDEVDNDLTYFEDIYYSEFKDGAWQPAQNIGKDINSEFHDASIGVSADGKKLFLYKDLGNDNGEILVSERKDDGSWGKPESIGKNINSSYNENAVSISPDGKTLFFSSNRPGGKGGYDIYTSKLDKNGEWGKPTNIGLPINTSYDDEGPFIDYDSKTLYFSSAGHTGMGGYDIFVAEYDSVKKKWQEPINIGYPINTPDNDIYFVKSGDAKYGYYASVKDGGLGETDIYKVLIPENLQSYDKLKRKDIEIPKRTPTITVKVDSIKTEERYPVLLIINIKDEKTGQAADAKVSVKSKKDNVEVGIIKVSTGVYRINFRNPEEMSYNISVESEGAMFKNEDIDIPAMAAREQKIVKEYLLSKIEVGFSSVLKNIYFDFDRASFKMDSYNELTKLERMLKENTAYRIEISGHTDNIGSHEYNMELSQRRANAVVSWLVQKGIDRSRLAAKGYGETKPLATNDDENDGREINRRTEFIVTDELSSKQ
ncbi:MAG: OmpA family protein [Verrucomicrobia bacterium]|nr:OmpA family protein [Cytophagales bacterium]